MTKRARILLGGMVLALMSSHVIAYIYSVSLPKKGSDAGWGANWGKTLVVNRVDPDGPATDLRIGDEVIAINGVKIMRDSLSKGASAPPGTRETMTIRRAGELRDVTIQTVPHKTRKRFDPHYFVSLLFLLTGWGVFLLRPDDKQAWLLAVMLGTLTSVLGSNPTDLPSWLSVVSSSARAVGILFLPIFVHFFLVFPETAPLLQRRPRVEIYLYLPSLIVISSAFGVGRFLAWFSPWLSVSINAGSLFIIAAYLAAGLICLAINYRAASPIARRRLRVIMAGSAAGLLNLFLLVVGILFTAQNRVAVVWSWLESATFITLPLIPLSFVYAIVRHKVIPVSLIIRRGLRYLLVSRGSVLLLMIIVSVVMYIAMDAFFYWNPMSWRRVGIISAVVAIAVWQLARAFHLRVVAPKIDQLFFHQAYDARQVIAELAESLRSTTSRPQLLELVAMKIQSALHSSNVAVLLRGEAGGDYPCVYFRVYSFHNRGAMPYPCDGGLTRDSAVIRRLIESGQLIDLDGRDDLRSENGGSNELSSEDSELLRKLNSALLLPIMAKDGLF